MTLYHVSPRRNDKSIAAIGLDPMRSQGKQHVVWFCSAARIPWALAHVAKHHKVEWRTLTLWTVRVPRRGLQRRRRGVWNDIRCECVPATKLRVPEDVPYGMRRKSQHADS